MGYLVGPCDELSATEMKRHAEREYRDMGDSICCLKWPLIGLNGWQKYSMTNATLFVPGPLKGIPWNHLLLTILCMCNMIYWFFLVFQYSMMMCGESTGHRWIPRTKASEAELCYFLWSASESTIEQPMETPVIWNTIVLIMTSL